MPRSWALARDGNAFPLLQWAFPFELDSDPWVRTLCGTSFLPTRLPRKTRFVGRALFAVLVVGLAAACGGDAESGSPAKKENAPSVTLAPIAAADAADALDTVVTYLSGKSWGFFGAMCDRWVELDYEFSPEKSGNGISGFVA